jgi:hypothetical protein
MNSKLPNLNKPKPVLPGLPGTGLPEGFKPVFTVLYIYSYIYIGTRLVVDLVVCVSHTLTQSNTTHLKTRNKGECHDSHDISSNCLSLV